MWIQLIFLFQWNALSAVFGRERKQTKENVFGWRERKRDRKRLQEDAMSVRTLLLRMFCMCLLWFMSMSLSYGCTISIQILRVHIHFFSLCEEQNKKTKCFFAALSLRIFQGKHTQNNTSQLPQPFFNGFQMCFFFLLSIQEKNNVRWHFIAEWWFNFLDDTFFKQKIIATFFCIKKVVSDKASAIKQQTTLSCY